MDNHGFLITDQITEFIEFIVNQSFLGFGFLSNLFCDFWCGLWCYFWCDFSSNWGGSHLFGFLLFSLSWLVIS